MKIHIENSERTPEGKNDGQEFLEPENKNQINFF